MFTIGVVFLLHLNALHWSASPASVLFVANSNSIVYFHQSVVRDLASYNSSQLDIASPLLAASEAGFAHILRHAKYLGWYQGQLRNVCGS